MKYKHSIYNNIYHFDNGVYLYNSHSGAFARIDKETQDYLTNISENSNAKDNKYFDYLQSKGIIVPEHINEFWQFQIRSLCNRFDPTPDQLAFVIITTTACNYRCFYCYENGIESKNMHIETQQAVAEFICKRIQATRCKSLRISWFGGEPLLNASCIKNISDLIIPYCLNNNVNYSANIITNGSMVTASSIDLFNHSRIDSIQITIDGNLNTYCNYKSASPQSYKDVLNAIKLLHNTFRVNIRLNTDGRNYDALKAVVKEIITITDNHENIYFYLAKIEGFSNFHWDDFFNLKIDFFSFLYDNKMFNCIEACLPKAKYLTCGLMQQNNAVIDTDGGLLRCEHYAGQENEVIGSVFYGNYYSNEKKFIDDPVEYKCTICSLYPICRRGCAQKRIDFNQNVNCEAFKKAIRENLYFISKSALN